MDLSYSYMKKRADFGRQPIFCEQGPEFCDSKAADPNEFGKFILRNPVTQEVQHGPVFSKNVVNTYRANYAISGVNHAEGGWPKDVNVQDPEATQRYRRKVEKDDGYIRCIQSTCPGVDHYVLQNNAIDMYKTYFKELPSVPDKEKISCRMVNIYRDPSKTPRPVSSIAWQPNDGDRFAVSYLDIDFYKNALAPVESFVWNIENATKPELVLTPPTPLLDLQFNPRDKFILIGGQCSGQTGVWDRRKGSEMVDETPPHEAHREPVKCVVFINSKTGAEFISSGPDGSCKWWDLRNLNEPTDEIVLDAVKYSFDTPSMAQAHGCYVLEYEPTIPTRFMVGTEDGYIICGNKKGKTPMEKLPSIFQAHLGPIYSLERNPFFLKNFLTVGDWTARIWSEECRESAILWSAPQRYKITAGTWSPGRISLLYLAQSNGLLSLWDIMRRQYEPILTVQVCEEPLLRLKMHDNATLMACGSAKGNIYMQEISPTLAKSEKNDKSIVTAMFERETKRERILESRMREIRLKIKQAEEGSIHSIGEPDPSVGDKDLAEATTDYMANVRKEMSLL